MPQRGAAHALGEAVGDPEIPVAAVPVHPFSGVVALARRGLGRVGQRVAVRPLRVELAQVVDGLGGVRVDDDQVVTGHGHGEIRLAGEVIRVSVLLEVAVVSSSNGFRVGRRGVHAAA